MQQGFVVWLTGLSGAGKTTIAQKLSAQLSLAGHNVEILDGDLVRQHLSYGLGFSRADRDTNIRRIAFVAGLLARNGVAVIVAAISPYRATREEARTSVGRFVEVYVKCPLEELVRRDVKGLYARALRGEVANFTGVSDPYEEPLQPEVVVATDTEPVVRSVQKVTAALSRLGYLSSESGLPAGNPSIQQQVTTDLRRPISPHGGELVNRLASEEASAYWTAEAPRLPALTLNARQMSDVEMLAIGGYSPLTGFLGSSDYHSVVERMRLTSGVVWPIPITLAVSKTDAARVSVGEPIALRDAAGDFLAIMHLQEKFTADVEKEARCVYQTADPVHPGVAVLYRQGPVMLAGPVILVRRPPAQFPAYRLDPVETRALFTARGWRRVVGFQTRNPIHRAHEYIQKAALETVDGLLLHPLVGETKDDDIPADIRMRCYVVLLEQYYPKNRTILAVNPAAMRYAGPREAIFHAIIRQNYGCTHFIVGRDHAGVGNYYGTYDAQRIFDKFSRTDLGITPLFFDHTYYCTACAGVVSMKTCPHDPSRHITLSGTQVRELLRAGKALPAEFTRPEVAALLAETMTPQAGPHSGLAVNG